MPSATRTDNAERTPARGARSVSEASSSSWASVSNRSIRRYRWWTGAPFEGDLAHLPAAIMPTILGSRLAHRPDTTFKTPTLVFTGASRRELVHVNVTANPTAAWSGAGDRGHAPGATPRHLLYDRDS